MTNDAKVSVVDGVLPVIQVSGSNLPSVWESAVLAVWEHGAEIATQYDKEGDPPSRDATMIMTIHNPMQEPRIHRAFPGGLEDLEIYRQEVTLGIHDGWIDPENGKWEYTYHERLFDYKVLTLQKQENNAPDCIRWMNIDQIQYVINELIKAPHSRRAQAITWKPWEDCGIHDPACLQSLWFRIFDDQLVMNVRMRSNDLFKANYMNLYSFIDLQRIVAERVSEGLGREIKIGQVNHFVDSMHLYSQYNKEIEAFIQTTKVRTFDQRVWNSNDPLVQAIFEETRERIKESLEREKATGRKGL